MSWQIISIILDMRSNPLRRCAVPTIVLCLVSSWLAMASGEIESLASPSGYRAVLADSAEVDPTPLVRILTPEGDVLNLSPGHEINGALHWIQWIGHESWPYDALVHWTGGMGCCFWYTFVSKDPPYRALPRFHGGTTYPELVDPDRDGVMEFIVREDTYSFGTDSVHRTIPEVIWRVSVDGPELAKDLMTAWRYDDSQLDAIRKELAEKRRSNDFLGWTQQITSTVINQYYATNNLNAARNAFDRIWTPSEDGKEGWWQRIVTQMGCSALGVPGVRCVQEGQ